MMSKLTFLLIESVRALFRARVPAIISSITIAITLVVFSSAYFFYVNMVGFTNRFTAQFNIEVFFVLQDLRDQSVIIFWTHEGIEYSGLKKIFWIVSVFFGPCFYHFRMVFSLF